MSDTFLMGLLAPIEAEITAAMAASLESSGDDVISYTFNSGQTVQTVQKRSLAELQKHIDWLLARRDTLRQRCGLEVTTYNAGANW